MEFTAHSVSRPISADSRAATVGMAIRLGGGPPGTGTDSAPVDSATGVAGTTRVLKPYGVAMLPSTDRQTARNPDITSRPGTDISRADPQSVTRAQTLAPEQQEPDTAAYSDPRAPNTAPQPDGPTSQNPGHGAARTDPDS